MWVFVGILLGILIFGAALGAVLAADRAEQAAQPWAPQQADYDTIREQSTSFTDVQAEVWGVPPGCHLTTIQPTRDGDNAAIVDHTGRVYKTFYASEW